MKKFYTIILGAVLSLAAVSCQQELQDNWTPGEAEDAFCYGVYFPVQEASGYHVYSPADAPKVVITVSRSNTSGAITVPVEASFSEEGIFEATPIAFADGQAETTFTLNFPTAKEGVEYSASFVITDNTYAAKYSSNAVALDFSVMRVEMKYFLDPKTKEKALITFDQGWWGEVATGYIKYYEVDDVRTCFTETIDHLYNGELTVAPGFWGYGEDYEWTFKWYVKKSHPTIDGATLIELPWQPTGYVHSTLGMIYLGDYVNEQNFWGQSWDWFAKLDEGAFDPSYYDGNGGFYFSVFAYANEAASGWRGDPYETVGVASGFSRVDYSLKIDKDYPSNGVTPIYVEAGADVKSVKYAVYEGALNSAQLDAKFTAIEKGEEENIVTFTEFTFDEDEAVNYAVIGLSPEKTATYTLVMVACDAEDNIQNNASLTFNHVNATDNDDYAVEVNAFTEDTPARYAELHSYDSFAYCVYGKELTEVHIGIISDATVAKYGQNYILDAVKSDADYAVDEDVLAQINADGGYYTIAKGVDAKTTYYVIVWATNGSRDNFAIASYKTDPLPYVWNNLGKGTITDGFLMTAFGDPDVTVPCDVYEEATTPGLYMVTGFQLALAAAFYGTDEATLAPYEGEDSNWYNAEIVVDATDPNAVYIGEQNYGIYVNGQYGYVQIDSEPVGTLVDGVITFPAKSMYLGLTNYGWLYGNTNGTFAITLPSAAAAAAITPAAIAPKNVEKAVLSSNVAKADRKAVYERDAQPVNVKAQTLAPARKEKATNVKAANVQSSMTVSETK